MGKQASKLSQPWQQTRPHCLSITIASELCSALWIEKHIEHTGTGQLSKEWRGDSFKFSFSQQCIHSNVPTSCLWQSEHMETTALEALCCCTSCPSQSTVAPHECMGMGDHLCCSSAKFSMLCALNVCASLLNTCRPASLFILLNQHTHILYMT